MRKLRNISHQCANYALNAQILSCIISQSMGDLSYSLKNFDFDFVYTLKSCTLSTIKDIYS